MKQRQYFGEGTPENKKVSPRRLQDEEPTRDWPKNPLKDEATEYHSLSKDGDPKHDWPRNSDKDEAR